ncbi:MAG TPA: hypothetical protein VK903_05370, partial [Propionicimonas sp.]|nr:hypothetical protein [Propionicimonas sp.]
LLQVLVARQAVRVGAASGPRTRVRRDAAPGRAEVIEGEIVAEEPAPGTRPDEGPGRLGR